MADRRKLVFQSSSLALVSVLALGLTGCPFKKKKPAVPQPAAQVPAITQPEPTPTPTPEPTPAPPPPQPEKPTIAEKPKPKPRKAPSKPVQAAVPPAPEKTDEKPEPTQQATAKPPRIVIQEGGAPASPGDITTPIAHDDATHRRLTTAQLQQSTEENLRGLKRVLSADEQATVAQVRDYMEQSRAAAAQDDLVRAHNLALKAHLLSDELAGK